MKTEKQRKQAKGSRPCTFLSHTADMRMMVQGKSLPDLFRNAALGLSGYLDISAEKSQQFCENIKVEAPDTEALLIRWLNELVYLSDRGQINFDVVNIKKLTSKMIDAQVKGRKLQVGSRQTHEIKAFTYHNLEIKKTKNGYKTEIVFDI